MAQFDVYINPSRNTAKTYPYLLDVQHEVIDQLATRIVIPLACAQAFSQQAMTRLTPKVTYQQQALLLMTPQLASVPASLLKQPIGSLADFRSEIIAALDFAFTGI